MAQQISTNAAQPSNTDDHFKMFLIWLFSEIARKHPNACLPSELRQRIFAFAGGVHDYTTALNPTPASAIAIDPDSPEALLKWTPPKDSTPFMTLPTELRRQIFATSLPWHDVLLHPKCASDPPASPMESKSNGFFINNKPRPNDVSNLMVVNKKICEEVAEVMYEERTFVIHVHEGLVKGGVEFLTTGLQPLQYLNLDVLEDNRFDLKFGRNQFSFRRLRRVVVQIHPSTEDEFRHTPVNTHFMVKALCSLLDRGDGEEQKNRITHLEVEFMKPEPKESVTGRRAIMREQHWWDPLLKQPRSTSVHNLSNIELALRPFEMLACHSVCIKLPDRLRDHQPTVDFVEKLEKTMTSVDVMDRVVDDDTERKIEALRQDMENYVINTAHGDGKGSHTVEDLTSADLQDDEKKSNGYDSAIDDSGGDSDDCDDSPPRPSQRLAKRKLEERLEEQRKLKSLKKDREREARDMQRAIEASMEEYYPGMRAVQAPVRMSQSMDAVQAGVGSSRSASGASASFAGGLGTSRSVGSSRDNPIDVDDGFDDDFGDDNNDEDTDGDADGDVTMAVT